MTDFDAWWHLEGSTPPLPGEDGEEHCKRMCQIAWSNGAYKAKGWSEPLDRLLDEAKVLADDRPVEVGNLPEWSLDAEHMIRRLVKAFNSASQPPQYSDIVSDGGLDPRNKFDVPAQQGCVRCNTPKKCALHGCSPLTWPAEEPAQQEPCGWQFHQDGKWHNGMETNNHRANTEAAGVPVRDVYPSPQPAQQEPWGACVYGRVFVGRLPEHARKFSEDEGVPIQWLYTSPQSQRKPLTDDHTKLLWHEARRCIGPRWMVFKRLIEAAHGIKERNT